MLAKHKNVLVNASNENAKYQPISLPWRYNGRPLNVHRYKYALLRNKE